MVAKLCYYTLTVASPVSRTHTSRYSSDLDNIKRIKSLIENNN
jgi:hypothetical protein